MLYFVGLLQQLSKLKRSEASEDDANKNKQHANVLFSNTPSTHLPLEDLGKKERRHSEEEEATFLSW